jgi:hypothetical protein
MQMSSKSNMLTVVLCLFTYSILFDLICGENFLNFHARGHVPLPARFFNYQSQPATFLVQPPTSNHSETPGHY